MPASTPKMPTPTDAPEKHFKTLDAKLTDNATQKNVALALWLYENRNVYNRRVFVEGAPFKVVNRNDLLTPDEKPWFNLFAAKSTVSVTGGLDLRVEIDGLAFDPAQPDDPHGFAWMTVVADGKKLEPVLEVKCDEQGEGEATHVYHV